MNETKQGIIAEVIYKNSDNGYMVAVFETEDPPEQFTVTGVLPVVGKGRSFKLEGEFKAHPKYGEQFVISRWEEMMPSTDQGLEAFLTSGVLKGIGKKTAALIIRQFGADTLRILEEEPHRLTEISGIGDKKAQTIAEAYAAHREFATVAMFFQQHGISTNYALKIYKVYGLNAEMMVKENPYRLASEVFGIGFKKADKIAEQMGVEKTHIHRIESGVLYLLWNSVDRGHTYLPQKELCLQGAELLDIDSAMVEDVLPGLAIDGRIRIELLEGRAVVFLYNYYIGEKKYFKMSVMVKKNESEVPPLFVDIESRIKLTEGETGVKLSENQKFAVSTCLKSGVSIITGGPGTGKTTIINTILNILEHCGIKTAIAAPTGRAAKRITETGGYPAVTIHRLLEYYYSEGEDAMRFGRTEENPLEYGAVVIDEASMVDIMLMNGLVSALQPSTRLIMVGDDDQLPPVGPGNVLKDIIQSELIYTVKLTEIFRQAQESLIVVNAHRINRGEMPYCNETDKDFFLVPRKGEKEMLATLLELCLSRLPSYYEDCDPKTDIQVITPMKKGLLGSINLNKELQERLNPPARDRGEHKFGERTLREGDKVMQIKNNYRLPWKKKGDFEEGEGVFNGEVGLIKHIDEEDNAIVVAFDEDKYTTYEFSQADELEHAYAITVHKSQGSEFAFVVMPMTWFAPMLATRNLLYTAVTRGKRAVIIVGSAGRMQGMIENDSIVLRYSGLRTRLEAFLKKAGEGEG